MATAEERIVGAPSCDSTSRSMIKHELGRHETPDDIELARWPCGWQRTTVTVLVEDESSLRSDGAETAWADDVSEP